MSLKSNPALRVPSFSLDKHLYNKDKGECTSKGCFN